MKNTGILRIQAFGARQSSPIEGVLVTVSGNGFTAQRITDETGTAADLSIEAPSCALSLQEDNTIRPYAVVDLTAAKAGFRTVRIQGVQIFAGQVTLAQPEMIPETEEDRDVVNPPIVIPEHSLFTGDGGSGPDPMENCVPRVLDRVIIPKNITVHLGKPAAAVRNVTVSFRDYIANVASSEVYPTWPEQALRANIHCQISLALNRIYTEWYPSKGYTFNITNSTSYDQYYVHGRTVFDVMVRITDDIFNTYIRKTGTVNPYYSEYCDGKSVTCPGLKQWGTVTLANQGRNALQILKYYYGNDIEIIRTSNIQSIPQSYPGSPIRQGDSGTAVFTLQRQLNRITKDYPFLGLLTVDGVFGAKMAATVRAFQRQFNLTADGVVGRQTWYKISYIYVSVKDLAELTGPGSRVRLVKGAYHEPAEVRALFSLLTGKDVDESCFFFPPFYTDCGKNITFGKNVFLNTGCTFQDLGGVTIGDATQIGQNVTLCTLNHGLAKSPAISRHSAVMPLAFHRHSTMELEMRDSACRSMNSAEYACRNSNESLYSFIEDLMLSCRKTRSSRILHSGDWR